MRRDQGPWQLSFGIRGESTNSKTEPNWPVVAASETGLTPVVPTFPEGMLTEQSQLQILRES